MNKEQLKAHIITLQGFRGYLTILMLLIVFLVTPLLIRHHIMIVLYQLAISKIVATRPFLQGDAK